jgi:hypothetical protein
MKINNFLKIQPFYYEEETVVETPTETTTVTPSPTPTPEEKKLLPQDQVNRLLKQEREKAEEKARKGNEATIRQLEQLKKTAALTEEEKSKLETRIEDLKNEYLTKEQLDKKKQKEEADKAKKQQEELSKDRDNWKNLYETSIVERKLLDAGIEHEAFNPEQILEILKTKTRLVDERDAEDKPTGRFVPKVRLAGKDKDGNTVILDLTPTDAVKQMKEMPEIYGNLFKSGAHSGIGGNNNQSSRGNLGGPPTNDTVAYRQWRKQQPGMATRR